VGVLWAIAITGRGLGLLTWGSTSLSAISHQPPPPARRPAFNYSVKMYNLLLVLIMLVLTAWNDVRYMPPPPPPPPPELPNRPSDHWRAFGHGRHGIRFCL
jgi:hypothetical protein